MIGDLDRAKGISSSSSSSDGDDDGWVVAYLALVAQGSPLLTHILLRGFELAVQYLLRIASA
jgi:hypothetical protein